MFKYVSIFIELWLLFNNNLLSLSPLNKDLSIDLLEPEIRFAWPAAPVVARLKEIVICWLYVREPDLAGVLLGPSPASA